MIIFYKPVDAVEEDPVRNRDGEIVGDLVEKVVGNRVEEIVEDPVEEVTWGASVGGGTSVGNTAPFGIGQP